MTSFTRIARPAALALALLGVACEGLSVPNLNDPDRTRALAVGDDLKNLLAGGYANWYFAMQDFTPSFATSTMADHMTASWGNFGMRLLSSEPRVEFPNLSTHGDRFVSETPWFTNYAALVAANLTVGAIRLDGVVVNDATETAMAEAAGVFLQGATLSNIALYFDKGFAVDETTDLTSLTFSTRAEVRDAALAKLEEAATLALAAPAFQLPDNFLNITGWTNTQLAQVANTIAARTVAYFARNATENAAADWAAVLQYASNGISSGTGFDPAITGNNDNWYDAYKYHGDEFVTWTRVDQRIVCMLDATQPCQFPDAGTLPRPNSLDARIALPTDTTAALEADDDFVYRTAIPFNPARGRYHFSHIGHRRYIGHARLTPTAALGVVPFILRAENDLLWAEALIRTGGDKALAAEKINNSRVVRGQLAPLTGAEADQVMLDAIFYERDVELFASAALVPYYDMRRTGRMQPLTPLHFPVPARELEVLRQQLYTFGGSTNPQFAAGAEEGTTAGAGEPEVFSIARELRTQRKAELGVGIY